MPSEPLQSTITQAIQLAVEHHQAGRLADAERIYRRVLEVDPENREALHLLGLIAHQTGNHELAVQLIGRAIVHGADPYFLNNRAAALQQLGRYAEALADYDA